MLRRNWKLISLIVIALGASGLALMEDGRIFILNERLACVATWLEKAKSLHTVEMKEPGNFTVDTMRKFMDSVDAAYDCATREPSSGHAPGGGSFGQHGTMPPHK
jgi:hypothetical protein